METTDKTGRLWSLDALRGFDMLFIMGLAELVVCLCALWPDNAAAQWLTSQMGHVAWDGLAHHDTIFPLFLFIAGISFPFSMAKQRASGRTNKQIYMKIVKRGIVLVFLGLVYNGLFDFSNLRCASVLARIGLAWMFSALLFVSIKSTKILAGIAAFILVGYWLLLWCVPGGSETYSFDHNLVGMIDRALLPGCVLYPSAKFDPNWFDPEGLLSTLPAIVTAMLGMFTGKFVQRPSAQISGNKKTLCMLVAALVFILVGCVWSTVFPINKKLWTSSFVCVVAGYSLIMFALFYYIIDVKGHRSWTLFFRVVGLNSITIYLAQNIVDFQQISNFFLGGLASKCPEVWANIIHSSGYIAACWLFLYFLYQKKVFLKV